jgi:suppressor of tumorigenicity protein 13
MACPINQDEINKLKMFIQFASAQPQILNMPQLSFFKDFVEQLGGKVPAGNFGRLEISRFLISSVVS